MRSRRRNSIALLAVALVIAAISLAVYLRKRAAPEPARLLPSSDAVLYFNLKSVRRLTSFGSQPIGQREPEYEEFVRETGFQFERDLNEAAFAVHTVQRPPAYKGGPPGTEARYSEVFIGKFDGQKLSIRFQKSFSLQKEQASRPESLEFICSMFEKYFGRKIEIVCFLEGEERAFAIDEAVAKQKPQEERLRDVSEDKKPVLQKLMKDFDGEIVRYQT